MSSMAFRILESGTAVIIFPTAQDLEIRILARFSPMALKIQKPYSVLSFKNSNIRKSVMLKSALLGLLLLATCAVTLSGCYRRPCDDDYCVIPATNNSSITRHGDSFQPGMSY